MSMTGEYCHLAKDIMILLALNVPHNAALLWVCLSCRLCAKFEPSQPNMGDFAAATYSTCMIRFRV